MAQELEEETELRALDAEIKELLKQKDEIEERKEVIKATNKELEGQVTTHRITSDDQRTNRTATGECCRSQGSTGAQSAWRR